MNVPCWLALLVAQQPAQQPILAQPIARVDVKPAAYALKVGDTLRLAADLYAANNDRRYDPMTWTSTRPAVVDVNSFGRLTARALGQATVSVAGGAATDRWTITVVTNPTARVAVAPGDTAIRTGDVVRFTFSATDAARRPVADARPEWSVAPVGSGYATIDADGAFGANEPGVYRVAAALGPRTAEAFVRVADRGMTRPASIVGRLALKLPAAELWLHPDGTHAYISTIGDRIYAVDVTDPSHPAITDSVVVDARVVNDVMTTEDGKFGVMTREGASTRKNGLGILSFEDPAHPKPIAEFTETVTRGVHSTPLHRGYAYLTGH